MYMPVIKSETLEGRTYMLADDGGLWRVEFGYDGQPTIQRLDNLSHATKEGVMRPVFARWLSQ